MNEYFAWSERVEAWNNSYINNDVSVIKWTKTVGTPKNSGQRLKNIYIHECII